MRKILRSPDQLIFQAMLRDARKSRDLTQRGMASLIGRHQSFVAKYESGERMLYVIELLDILKALEIPPGVFVETLSSALSAVPTNETKR